MTPQENPTTYSPALALSLARNLLYRQGKSYPLSVKPLYELWRFMHHKTIQSLDNANIATKLRAPGRLSVSTATGAKLELSVTKTYISPAGITPLQICDTVPHNNKALGLRVGTWQPLLIDDNGIQEIHMPKRVYSLQPGGEFFFLSSLSGHTLFITDFEFTIIEKIDITHITKGEDRTVIFPMQEGFCFLLKQSKKIIFTNRDFSIKTEIPIPYVNWFIGGAASEGYLLALSSFLSGANYCDLIQIQPDGEIRSLCSGLEDPARIALNKNWLALSEPASLILLSKEIRGQKTFIIPVSCLSRLLETRYQIIIQGIRFSNGSLCLTIDLKTPGVDSETRTMVTFIKMEMSI